MTYAELLQEYIKNSGMTLERIAEECGKRGVKIHPTYISKLRLGKRPAPSEEISRVLAEVTGGDAQRLIIKGYIEKIPDDIKEELDVYKYLSNMDDLTDDFTSKLKETGDVESALKAVLDGAKKKEKLSLILSESKPVKALNVSQLRAILKEGLLLGSDGETLPEYQLRPLLAHVEALMDEEQR
ncbi:transcriptional regulator [Thermoactinomyces daqus]|uniref:Transcriptional regulator n=1 Tax=Thermoactinomyces daqus TaxID=1329516 RepID=A0A7W1X8C2_9BACL|nr:transcriptional regulator [Thermoactinomyces daqus]MBA4541953.1 transcriptional regulator [Thermoactinomyces daqus]